MEPIEQHIATFIADKILFNKTGYPYSYETSFLEEGIIDSTNFLEIVFFTEETFGLSVDDSEIIPDNFDSINKLADYIRKKQDLKIKA